MNHRAGAKGLFFSLILVPATSEGAPASFPENGEPSSGTPSSDNAPKSPAATPERLEPDPKLQSLWEQASLKFEASDYDGAILTLTEALELSLQTRNHRIRVYLIVYLGIAHQRAYEVKLDPTDLRLARDFFQRYFESDEQYHTEKLTTLASENLAAIEERLNQLEEKQAAEAKKKANTPAPTTSKQNDPVPEGPSPTSLSPRLSLKQQRKAGIAMTSTGTLLGAGGLTLLIYAALGPTLARKKIEENNKGNPEFDWDNLSPDEKRYLEIELPREQMYLYLSGTVSLLGAAGLITGGTIFLQRSRSTAPTRARIQLLPTASPTSAGAVLQSSFLIPSIASNALSLQTQAVHLPLCTAPAELCIRASSSRWLGRYRRTRRGG